MSSDDIIFWVLVFGAVVLPVVACRRLIADARSGWEISMGGDMLFGNFWLFAGGLAGGALAAAGYGWWWVIVGLVIFHLDAQPVRRLIRALYLGADLPAPESKAESGGFAAMDRKAQKHRVD